MRALAQLPSPDQIRSMRFMPDALPHLSSIRALTLLDIALADVRAVNPIPAVLLVPHLAGCAQLTDITLRCFAFTEADLQTLVSALQPQLQVCTFHDARLASLIPFLGTPHLRELNIIQCRGLRLIDLLPLVEVKSLRQLTATLPVREHEAAQFMLSHPRFQHIRSFEVHSIGGF